jgi:type VI secretion system protein ImpK
MYTENSRPARTVLLSHDAARQGKESLTDIPSAPRFEDLEDRMVYSARLEPPQAFSASVNILVTAAAELLAYIIRLKTGATREDLGDLNKRLCACVRRFDVLAVQKGVGASEAQAARYVLCTVVDEAVVTTAWGDKSEWARMSLLSQFHGETFGGEKFFKLLNQVVQSPEKYMLLLELMYICLSLGFEGKYRVKPRGSLELEGIRDSVYRHIANLRGEVPRALSPHWEGLHESRQRLVRVVPWWLVVTFMLISLTGIYSGFAWVLGEQREAVLHSFRATAPSLVHSQL